MREDLLQPSLTSESAIAAPPSTQAMFLTSFFGGPGAAVAIIAIGSYRLRRLGRDLPVLLALLIAPLGLIAWVRIAPTAQALRNWIESSIGNSGYTYLYRAMGLLCFGIGYWLHLQAHRNSELMGLKPPNGWLVGLPCLIAGYAFMVLVLSAVGNFAIGRT
jgi:hypothetical protein